MLTTRIEILVGSTIFVSNARTIPMCPAPGARRAGSAGMTTLGYIKTIEHASVDMFADKTRLVRTLSTPEGAFGPARPARVTFFHGEETDSRMMKHQAGDCRLMMASSLGNCDEIFQEHSLKAIADVFFWWKGDGEWG